MVKKKNKYSGFTLLEMLISISIFMIFLGIVSGSYTSLVSANRSANDVQKLYHDVRDVFDTISTEIRSGVIDYSCVDTLCILHNNGSKRSLFKFDAENKRILVLHQSRIDSESRISSWISDDPDWLSLTSEKFPVQNFLFTIFPLKDPYVNATDDDVQWQPSVTFLLNIDGYVFRTIYSSRSYGSKNIYATL